MSFLRAVALLMAKDFQIELRAKETLATMGLVAILTLLIFVFALDAGSGAPGSVPVGVLWASLLFGAAVGLGRLFARERQDGRLLGLLMAPVDRSAIFVAKGTGFFLLQVVMAAAIVPAFAAFFHVSLPGPLWRWAALVALVAAGVAGVGTLLAAVTVYTRAPELLLPVLLFPLLVPLLLGAVSVSKEMLVSGQWQQTAGWVRFMMAYDLLFIAVPALMFEYVVEV